MTDGARDASRAVHDRARLEALLGGPALAWIRERVRARLSRGEPPTGTATLRDPSPEERAALDRLLGRRPTSGRTLGVRLEEVDRILRDAGVADGLAAAVVALDGPVRDRKAAEEAEARAWAETFHRAVAEAPPEPWAEAWLEDLRATGLVRRLAGTPEEGSRLLSDAFAVLRSLPAEGVGLPRFAARTLGDSHALDEDRPVTTLVLRAIQQGAGGAEGPDPVAEAGAGAGGGSGAQAGAGAVRSDRPSLREERRALWASVGVLLDELARPVLVLGLRGRGDGLTDRVLAAHAEAGEPARLTLRQLVRHPPDLSAAPRETGQAPTVHVCENPAMVEAAARELGSRSRPLLCVEGQPATAQQTLLRRLRRAGWALAYHGDFDWSGIRIGNLLVARFGARPWRFATADYRSAPDGPPLTGTPVEADWDPALAAVMERRGRAVHEEQVLATLLEDLDVCRVARPHAP